ncbi:MAG: Outer rane receptor protein, partial [Bacteroidetes bacterium]|nr:Outer rane receptor protein [Bacteroidota bacterium]
MIRKTLFFGFFLCLPVILLGQTTGKISGKVTDEKRQPAVGANVLVEGTTLGGAADLDGEYFIINVPPGTYTLRAGAVGFASYRVSNVQVTPGLTAKVDIVLRSADVQLSEVVVEHERPAVQKDLTSKVQGFAVDELQKLPVQSTL